jgi:cysteine desulfurase/selenocysteine lyase
MNPEDFRGDFPLTQDLIYLDNAATSLMPVQVADEVRNYDLHYRANTGRGIHRLSVMATHRFRDAHDTIRSFIGGNDGTLFLTKNTTEAIETVASGIPWKPGDRVVTTILEHHSNLLPWLRLAKFGVETDLATPDNDGGIDSKKIEDAIKDDTKLVAVTHISNVTGIEVPVKEIAEICREKGVRLLVDGASPHLTFL